LYYDYDDQRYTNAVTAALLGNFGLVINNKHKIGFKNLYTINSDNTTLLREGINVFSAAEQNRTSLEFVSSRVLSSNLTGEHLVWRSSNQIAMERRHYIGQPRPT
jgi:hypothetical protein